MSNTTQDDWDETSPIISQPRRQGAAEINSLRKGVRVRLEKEHNPLVPILGLAGGGEHKAGSAVAYYQSLFPTLRPGGAALTAADNGRLWVDSDDKRLYVYTHPNWVVAEGPDPIVTATGVVNPVQVASAAGWQNLTGHPVLVHVTCGRPGIDQIYIEVDPTGASGFSTVAPGFLVGSFRFISASVLVPNNGKLRTSHIDVVGTDSFGQTVNFQ